MDSEYYTRRQNAVRERFKGLDIEALIISRPEEIHYLTGARGITESFCLITSGGCYLLTDGRFKEWAHQKTSNTTVLVYHEIEKYAVKQGIYVCLKDLAEQCGFKKSLGAEKDLLFEDIFKIGEHFGERVIYCGDLVEQLAIVKDDNEIGNIERVMKLTETVFSDHILPLIRPGVAENELAAWISFYGKKYGAEKDAFDIIVASGARSSLPHGITTAKQIQKGEMVQFDFGYTVDGYSSDFSRVVFVGKPTKGWKKIYGIVREAQELAIAAAKPGITCAELDLVARNYIKKQGYDISHGLGHGLGILAHSAPKVSPLNISTTLKPGFVITIEPGIYIPGWGGIRLEDTILITETGARNMTSFTKEIIIV